jgi:hypothetical protein
MPRLMIFRPWPMILRSLPMTDFSPLEGALMDGCGPAGPLAPAGRVVRGSSAFGSADGLRVNMKSPNLPMKNASSTFVAQAQVARHDVSSSSSFRCLRERPCGDGEGPRICR